MHDSSICSKAHADFYLDRNCDFVLIVSAIFWSEFFVEYIHHASQTMLLVKNEKDGQG